jgi:hypothetical protein
MSLKVRDTEAKNAANRSSTFCASRIRSILADQVVIVRRSIVEQSRFSSHSYLKSTLLLYLCNRQNRRKWFGVWDSSSSRIVIKFLRDLDIFKPRMCKCPAHRKKPCKFDQYIELLSDSIVRSLTPVWRKYRGHFALTCPKAALH